MNKYFTSIASAALLLGMLIMPVATQAQTTSSLSSGQISAIISLLQAFGADQSVINNVEVSLGATVKPTTGSSWCYNWNTNLGVGSSGPDVVALNDALNNSGFATGRDAIGSDSVFGEGTAAVVVQFQQKYGITPLSGYVGPLTRGELNSLYGCGNQTPPSQPPQPVYPTVFYVQSSGESQNSLQPGDQTTIYGTGFAIGDSILLGAYTIPSSDSPADTNSTLTFTVPISISTGATSLYVSNSNGTSNPVTVTIGSGGVYTVPTISSVGAPAGTPDTVYTGQTASVFGTNLNGQLTVNVGFQSVSVNNPYTDSLDFTVPSAIAAGSNVSISITNSLGQKSNIVGVTVMGASSSTSSTEIIPSVSNLTTPTLTSISPNFPSSVPPGSLVWLYGSGFDASSYILWTPPGNSLSTSGGVSSSAVSINPNPNSISASSLSFTVPTNATPGSYTVQVGQAERGGSVSNSLVMTLTASTGNNTYTDSNLGFSFSYPNNWTLTKTANGNLITLANTDQYNDNITITEVPGTSVTNSSGKFGSVTYTYENRQLMTTGIPNEATGQATAGVATPLFTVANRWPVVQGLSSWKTDIVYIFGKGFLTIDSGGSGYTANLDPFVKTIQFYSNTNPNM